MICLGAVVHWGALDPIHDFFVVAVGGGRGMGIPDPVLAFYSVSHLFVVDLGRSPTFRYRFDSDSFFSVSIASLSKQGFRCAARLWSLQH